MLHCVAVESCFIRGMAASLNISGNIDHCSAAATSENVQAREVMYEKVYACTAYATMSGRYHETLLSTFVKECIWKKGLVRRIKKRREGRKEGSRPFRNRVLTFVKEFICK